MSTDAGQSAEDRAVIYLKKRHKFKILDRNWRRPDCEIDIVAKRKKAMRFIEVKYRSDERHGDGFTYITPAKLRQMRFAAERWVQEHGWTGDYQLDAVSIIGDHEPELLENVAF